MAETLLQIIERKNQRIEDIPEAFQSSVEKLQRRLYNRITELIGQLEVRDGQIVMSEANLLRVQNINDELKQVLNGREYIQAVRKFTDEFNTQKAVNDEYFLKAFGSDFTETRLANQLVRNSQRITFDLLAGTPAEANFITPIRAQLEGAVATGASYKDTIIGIREFVEGTPDSDGRLLRYSKQISWDAFAISDATYTNAIAEDLGVEWYRYSGGIVKDSRCFCVERDRQYFHWEEVDAWGRREDLGDCKLEGGGWAGMKLDTNENTIWSYRGGWGCRHTLSPVSIFIVPIDVILRNISNGNFEPSEFERTELNL